MRRRHLARAAQVAIGLSALAMVTSAGADARLGGWPQFRFDAAHTGFNPAEKALSPRNVPRLRRVKSVRVLGAVDSSPALMDGVVYVCTHRKRLYAIDAPTGRVKWSAALGTPCVGSPAVHDGTVYVTGMGQGGGILALDARSGRVGWSKPSLFPVGSVVGSGSRLVLTTLYGPQAFDAKTGRPLWARPLEPCMCSSAIAADKVFVAGATYPDPMPSKSELFALSETNGQVVWSTRIGSTETSPAVADDTVFTASYTGDGHKVHRAVALSAATGRIKWRTRIGTSPILRFSAPAVTRRVVYFVTPQDLYALNARTGAVLWRARAPRSVEGMLDSSPTVANGVVYLAGQELRAYDAKSGRVLRSIPIPGGTAGSPTVVRGAVYVGSRRGTLGIYRVP